MTIEEIRRKIKEKEEEIADLKAILRRRQADCRHMCTDEDNFGNGECDYCGAVV